MLTVYGDSLSGNCYKVKLVLELLRRTYEWVQMDVVKGETKCRKLAEPEAEDSDGDVFIHRYFCGDDGFGYAQTERAVTESSDFPINVTITSARLPGIDLSWRFDLEYQGQLGHCGFRHRDLVVTFADAAAEERCAAIWERVFGLRPVFVPI